MSNRDGEAAKAFVLLPLFHGVRDLRFILHVQLASQVLNFALQREDIFPFHGQLDLEALYFVPGV